MLTIQVMSAVERSAGRICERSRNVGKKPTSRPLSTYEVAKNPLGNLGPTEYSETSDNSSK